MNKKEELIEKLENIMGTIIPELYKERNFPSVKSGVLFIRECIWYDAIMSLYSSDKKFIMNLDIDIRQLAEYMVKN